MGLEYIAQSDLRPENYPVLLYELNENAMLSIFADSYERAATFLFHAHELLDRFCFGDYSQCLTLSLLTFHNLALCAQKQVFE